MKKIVNRTDDLYFKYIFGNPENKSILLDLVNSILYPDEGKERICDLDFVDRELDPELSDGKQYRLDLLAKTSNGVQLNIEVQTKKQPFLAKRIMCYWARLYSSQRLKGHNYDKLCPTYNIVIQNFVFFKDNNFYIHHVNTNVSTTGKPLNEDLKFVFIELPKWISLKRKAENTLEQWISFFSNDNSKIIEEYAMINNNIRAALEAEKKFVSDDAMWHRYLQHENAILERETELYEARQDGIAEGLTKGRAEGQAKAEAEAQALLQARLQEKTLNTARYLLAHGVSIEIIHGCTGLPVSTIETLQK